MDGFVFSSLVFVVKNMSWIVFSIVAFAFFITFNNVDSILPSVIESVYVTHVFSCMSLLADKYLISSLWPAVTFFINTYLSHYSEYSKPAAPTTHNTRLVTISAGSFHIQLTINQMKLPRTNIAGP